MTLMLAMWCCVQAEAANYAQSARSTEDAAKLLNLRDDLKAYLATCNLDPDLLDLLAPVPLPAAPSMRSQQLHLQAMLKKALAATPDSKPIPQLQEELLAWTGARPLSAGEDQDEDDLPVEIEFVALFNNPASRQALFALLSHFQQLSATAINGVIPATAATIIAEQALVLPSVNDGSHIANEHRVLKFNFKGYESWAAALSKIYDLRNTIWTGNKTYQQATAAVILMAGAAIAAAGVQIAVPRFNYKLNKRGNWIEVSNSIQ